MMTAMSVKATPRPRRGREVLSVGGETVVVIVVGASRAGGEDFKRKYFAFGTLRLAVA